MVKSKKMSKTSIAVIVLALLLVLSMVMGLTGAWFFSKDDSGYNGQVHLQFGQIGQEVGVAVKSGTSSTQLYNAVPGDTVSLAGATVSYQANFSTYVFIEVNDIVILHGEETISATDFLDSALTLNLTGWEAVPSHSGVYYKLNQVAVDTEAPAPSQESYSYDISEMSSTIKSSLVRANWEGTVVTINYTITAKVMQAAHMADAKTAYEAFPA